MKLTLSNVKELKRASTNLLTKHVCKTNACTLPFPMSGISPTNGTQIISDQFPRESKNAFSITMPNTPITAVYGSILILPRYRRNS